MTEHTNNESSRPPDKGRPAAPTFTRNLATLYPFQILLADDNVINQKVGAGLLLKLGYATKVVCNGREAIEALAGGKFDLLFLDVQMPEMDGYEAARKINELYGLGRPIIIAMTGAAMEEDRNRCFMAGMDDYISKPVRITDVEAALRRWGESKKNGAA